jgi:ribosomal protein S18 acetylase RimI-like enzyme
MSTSGDSNPSTAPRVAFTSLNSNNLGTVRKLNSVLFPIKYSEKFYQEIVLAEAEDFCKLIYYNDVPVGTICCRLESKDNKTKLYLMTMGVLAPYRSRCLGSQGLDLILASAAARGRPKIDKIYLHVQTSNVGAKRFYERHGFREVEVHKNYYKKIEPHDAWVLEKDLL